MALLDRERNVIVLRVVYDGLPEAGKTTSLRALAGSLGQPLFTPGERDGRTLFFDWMDYTAGRFEGYQIRCQIVSVPGQRALRKRRRHLLKDADVVVHVADSRREKLPETMKLLAGVAGVVGGTSGPPVGVIVQANKRDLPDAVPMDELRATVRQEGWSMGVVESVAADGTGIREAFVFAVRLALDRVRELIRTQALPTGRPGVDSGEALYADMKDVAEESEKDPRPSIAGLAGPLLEQVLGENEIHPYVLLEVINGAVGPSAPDASAPWPPDPAAPSGAIWPPVEGRLILHEAAATPMATRRVARGGWAAGIGSKWAATSDEDAVFADMEAGRATLIRWARMHVACTGFLSPDRCVVLADTGDGRWRLWQIVRAERSLRRLLEDIATSSVDDAARRIVEAATLLYDALERAERTPLKVPCTLDTVGRGDRGAVYIGLMPMELASDVRAVSTSKDGVAAEIASVLARLLPARQEAIVAAIGRLPTPSSVHPRISALVHLLQEATEAPRALRAE